MPEKPPKKNEAESELELIKSVLSTNLDESTVDIFAQDLFGEPKTEAQARVKEKPEPEKQTEPVLKPEEAEEIKMPSAKASAPEPPPAQAEMPEPELSWEKPPEEKALIPPVPQKPEPVLKEKGSEELMMEMKAEELRSLVAVKEEEKIDETGEILKQLERMGDDFLSAEELKKLFQNVNLMIDLLHKALFRLEELERELKKKGIIS